MKRIVGREAASQIAAASLASFLPLAADYVARVHLNHALCQLDT